MDDFEEKSKIVKSILDQLDGDCLEILIQELVMRKLLDIRLEIGNINMENGDFDRVGIMELESMDSFPTNEKKESFVLSTEFSQYDINYLKSII